MIVLGLIRYAKTVELNRTLTESIEYFIDGYYPSEKNTQEGIVKLTDLAKDYHKLFFSNSSECPYLSNNWLENHKNEEIQAQVKWELNLVKKQEGQDFLGENSLSDEIDLFKKFMNVARNRILLEKECGSIANSKFPLEAIDYSNSRFTYITKANQEVEINYIAYRNSKEFPEFANRPSGISIIHEAASEIYIKNQIQNITRKTKDIIPNLKYGYQICQKLRDIMETSQSGVKLSVNDATKTMIEDKENKIFIGADSVNDEQEIITVTVIQLCPQLMK